MEHAAFYRNQIRKICWARWMCSIFSPTNDKTYNPLRSKKSRKVYSLDLQNIRSTVWHTEQSSPQWRDSACLPYLAVFAASPNETLWRSVECHWPRVRQLTHRSIEGLTGWYLCGFRLARSSANSWKNDNTWSRLLWGHAHLLCKIGTNLLLYQRSIGRKFYSVLYGMHDPRCFLLCL